MGRPLIIVSDEPDTPGTGFSIHMTRRFAMFGFWSKGRSVDIYFGEIADEIRRDMEEGL